MIFLGYCIKLNNAHLGANHNFLFKSIYLDALNNVAFIFFCRYICEIDTDVTKWSGNSTKQNINKTWPTKSSLQGDFYVPGSTLSAA